MLRQGFCPDGSTCGYCHEDHPKQSVKLDKQQRKMMQQLTHKDLFALLIPHIRKQVALAGIADEAQGLLRALTAGRWNDDNQSWAGGLRPHHLRDLDRMLAKLPLLALVKFCPLDTDAVDVVELLLGQIRCEMQLKRALATGSVISL